MIRYLIALTVFTGIVKVQAQPVAQRLQHITDSVYAANAAANGFMVYVEAPDRKLSWGYAVGYADKNKKQPLSWQQPVLIASNTKPYVSATLLRLVEQHKLSLDTPIGKLLSPGSKKLLAAAGYHTGNITLKHLLSHTSGIHDYVDAAYFSFIGTHKKHRWTRDEQIARAAGMGKPLFEPGAGFRYADINYILLTEIIERVTHQSFYQAMRSLLNYKGLQLQQTWFALLEKTPAGVAPAAHQYWDEFKWDTYDLDPSWDLYGGGGMKATVKDMAFFFQYLFNGKVIQDPAVLALMHTDVPPDLDINYCLGIRKISYSGLQGYNHGGGLGTDVIYIPQLNATIAVAALEAGHRPAALAISKEIIKVLSQEAQ